jgi:hypothetical protein
MKTKSSIFQINKKKTQHMQNKNSTKFYCKEETKTEQGYDKKCTQNWC